MSKYHIIDLGSYRFGFEITGKVINNVDVFKKDNYMGDETSYYNIMTTNRSRVHNPDGMRLSGTIFKRVIVVPPNMYSDTEIMDVDNPDAIAYPTGLTLYCDKYDFDEEAFNYLCMLLYDYATINGNYMDWTRYILDKKYPAKELNWN